MVHYHLLAENPLDACGELCGERYFRNKEQHLSPLAQNKVDQVKIYFGFSRRGDAVEQYYRFFVETLVNAVEGGVLGIGEGGEGAVGLSVEIEAGSFHKGLEDNAFVEHGSYDGRADAGCIGELLAGDALEGPFPGHEVAELHQCDKCAFLHPGTFHKRKQFVQTFLVAASGIDAYIAFSDGPVAFYEFLADNDGSGVEQLIDCTVNIIHVELVSETFGRHFAFGGKTLIHHQLFVGQNGDIVAIEVGIGLDCRFALDFESGRKGRLHHFAACAHVIVGNPVPKPQLWMAYYGLAVLHGKYVLDRERGSF